MTILKTRLCKTFIKNDYVNRERLISFLNNEKKQPLRLVVAGAGYGKSVTIAQWLEQSKIKNCWISLEEDCNELVIFLSYLVEAVESVSPGKLIVMRDMLFSTKLPAQKVISQILINELEIIEEEIHIVLDDYHAITNKEVHDLIDDFLQHPPINIKLTIISRFDPPLKLNTLLAYDKICELRMKDLKLNSSEIKELSNNLSSSPLDNDITDRILELTEGWVIGIKMFLRNYSDHQIDTETFKMLEKNKNHLLDFLFDQFLSQFPVDVQKCLMIASCFSQFNSELIRQLCRSVFNNDHSSDDFDRYFFASTFIIPTDIQNEWFRFHHLVQDFLQHELKKNFTKDEIYVFFRKASDYFESIQSHEEALSCALKTADISAAVEIIQNNFHYLLDTDQFGRLDKWLKLLPAGTVEVNAQLLLIRAFIEELYADFTGLVNDLNSAKPLLPELNHKNEHSMKIWGDYFTLKSAVGFYSGDMNSAIENGQKALELFASETSYMHDWALAFKSFALNYTGKGDDAIKMLDLYLTKVPASYRISLMRNRIIKVMTYALQGNIHLIKNPALLVMEISSEESLWNIHVMACYYLASTNYFQNKLDEVDSFVINAINHGFSGRSFWVLLTYFVEGFRLLALEKHEILSILISEMHAYARNFNIENLRKLVTTFEIEVAIRRGNLELARSLEPEAIFDPFPVIFFFYIPQLTRIKLMLYDSENNNEEETKKLIEQYVELGTNTSHITLLIQSFALLALWHLKYGDQNEAVNNLKYSIDLAKESGNIRTFLDLGEEMRILFNKLSPEEQEDTFIKQIIKIFKSGKQKSINSADFGRANKADLEAIDELSEKDLEILRLVAMGFQNKEIAEKIFLSPATIKTYLYRIYGKLGVKNRMGAISKTRQLYPNILSKRTL